MENIKKFELLSLLPIEVRKSKEFTKSQKRILSQLLFYNGMDKVRTDGYFFIDNDRLCKECKVTLKTLLIARNMFSNLGFITTTKGKRGKSTEYRINVDSIMNYNKKNTMTEYGDKNENKVTENSGISALSKNSTETLNENYTETLNENSTETLNDILLIVNELKYDLITIKSEIKNINSILFGNSTLSKNSTTDTELETELDINNILIIINNYINNNNLNNIYKKEINNNLLNIKNILKEKENIFINKNIKEKENILKNKKEIEVIKNIKNEDSALAEHAESNKKEIISISNEESCSGASTIEKLLVENDNILQLRGSYVKLFDVMGNLNSEEELDNTANSIHRWLKQHRDKQVLTQDESREMMFKLSERIHQLRSSIQSKSNTSQETAFSSSQSDLNGKDEQVINEKEKTQENVRKSLEMKLSEMLDKMELTPTMDKLDESYDSISDWLDENGDRLGKYSVRKIERRLNDVYFKHKDKVEYIPIEEVSATVQPNVLS